MDRQEAEDFMQLVIPSVFAEIEIKRKRARLPLHRENYDAAAATNQNCDDSFNQEIAIQKATTVLIQCCTKVNKFLAYNPKN